MKERLDKFISSQTSLSRKDAGRAIRDKRVTVNGAVCRTVDSKVDTDADVITLDGKTLSFQKYVYYMMYKPAGVVSTTEDRTEKTVLDILPEQYRRAGIFPAGRLDKDTTGLLLLTDDGDLAHRMLSPKKHVIKTYVATLDCVPEDGITGAFRAGIVLADGTVCKPGEVRLLDGCRVEVKISEGKYHQVKRMFASLGYKVVALERIAIGKLCLDRTLTEGSVRPLAPEEIDRIFA